MEKVVKDTGLADQVEVRGVGCLKLCCQGPLVQADPVGTLYEKVVSENAPSIVGALQGGGTTVPALVFLFAPIVLWRERRG